MKIAPELFKESALAELSNQRTQAVLQRLLLTLTARRKNAFSGFPDPQANRSYGAAIRTEAIARLPELLEQFEQNARANGAKVFWAADSEAANRYIAELARAKGVRYVTKGKSMITEELGLNDYLARHGITPWETDLGEFITQLLQVPPFHIVGPALNIPVEKVCEIFLQKGVLATPTLDPVALGKAARVYLRDKFRDLRMGITGVNIAVAESGTVINVENEGNIRFNKSVPSTLVCVMSIEKVVPTLADALQMLRLLCRSATGQEAGAYITFDSGPQKPGEIDGPQELHIVILDNGRSELYQDPQTREALRCVRCGVCLNACPVYGKVGGYPYGWAYSGPMGQVLMPALLGLERCADLIRACTLCQRCKTLCPAGIDHPALLLYYRNLDVEADPGLGGAGAPFSEKTAHRLFALAGSRSSFWRLFSKAAQRAAERFGAGDWIHRMGRLAPGWFASRDLPALPAKSFHARWRERSKRR